MDRALNSSGLTQFPDVTGDKTSKTGIYIVYDIFGLDWPQTQQGADILSTSTSSLAVIPDVFEGKPLPIETIPADTKEKQQKLSDFFAGAAHPGNNVNKIKSEILPALKQTFPSVEKWAILGFCWGGKVTTLSSIEGTPFVASVQCHPAMLDPSDAEKLVVPHLCISTKDEDKDATTKFEAAIPENLKGKSKVVYWEETFHGFMAARSNLKDKENYEYYQKG